MTENKVKNSKIGKNITQFSDVSTTNNIVDTSEAEELSQKIVSQPDELLSSKPSTSNGSQKSAAYERIAVFAFGVIFVIALIVLAIVFPKPTPFQYTVFRIILALAASGIAAFVPGFIEVEVKNWVRAGGAIAVFVIIYFFTPAGIVTNSIKGSVPTDPFTIHMFDATPQGTKVNRFTFPFSDVSKNASFIEFTAILSQLPGSKYSTTDYTIYRIRDEVTLTASSKETAVSDDNIGVMVIPNSLVGGFENEHMAFTYLWDQIQNVSPPNKANSADAKSRAAD